MASSQESLSLMQKGWLHELARAEVHPDAEKILQLGRGFDPQQLVEESTIDFLMELREHFNEYARIFNGYSESASRFQEVKIYSVAQTAADFMMFRNGIKLVISNVAHGAIQIAFAQHVRGQTSMETSMDRSSVSPPSMQISQGAQELLAQVGPFRDVYWTFQGERVLPEQVAKFYFAEFVRATRDQRRSRTSNQVLIEQVKALLQEKGIEL